jgi:hypothetical protein
MLPNAAINVLLLSSSFQRQGTRGNYPLGASPMALAFTRSEPKALASGLVLQVFSDTGPTLARSAHFEVSANWRQPPGHAKSEWTFPYDEVAQSNSAAIGLG